MGAWARSRASDAANDGVTRSEAHKGALPPNRSTTARLPYSPTAPHRPGIAGYFVAGAAVDDAGGDGLRYGWQPGILLQWAHL